VPGTARRDPGPPPRLSSAEALTPLHVAAAWGCHRGLELLLRHGADPALRDQDGLRPLDLAEQQGHGDCARVLRDLRPPGCPAWRTATVTAGACGAGLTAAEVTLEPAARPAGPERGDMGLGPSRRVASPTGPLEAADEEGGSESPRQDWDSSSDDDDEVPFVTAVEASDSEDTALERNSVGGPSLPQAEQGPMRVALRPTGQPGPSGKEAELGARLWAMTLSPSWATFFPPLVDPSTAHSNPQKPGLCPQADEQRPFGGDMAALWLTEDEASAAEDREHVPTCKLPPVPTAPGLQLRHRLPAPGHRRCPTVPFSQPPCGPQRQGEGWATPDFAKYSPELAEALRTGCIPDSQADEDALAQQFERPDPSERWREGVAKSSFTYLLLDPRETQDLPARASSLTPAQCLQTFVHAIFYVGKGTRTRPDVHLWEALGYRGRPGRQACPKVRRILDIWDSGHGVVSLHCFQHVVAVEAYTREACLVDALGVQTLTNQKQGHYYGVVVNWPAARRRRLGVHLLHRALLIFLAEGERELRPEDIQARG
ncbi:PREDICTED: ankyrin repeat and LEM domain-containing protein 1, partial [Chinchilla lanigera]|uniref:ankyrin repeat and LEM domain-containing protein 1 n=1 Tax=Chinchilla lanigera TaxID=34839 RepID=UPI0006972B42